MQELQELQEFRSCRSSGVQEFRSSGVQEFSQEFRSSGVQEFRSSGVQEFRSSGVQEFRSSGVQESGRRVQTDSEVKQIVTLNRPSEAFSQPAGPGRLWISLGTPGPDPASCP